MNKRNKKAVKLRKHKMGAGAVIGIGLFLIAAVTAGIVFYLKKKKDPVVTPNHIVTGDPVHIRTNTTPSATAAPTPSTAAPTARATLAPTAPIATTAVVVAGPTPAVIAACGRTYTAETRFADGACEDFASSRCGRRGSSQSKRQSEAYNYEDCFDREAGIKRGMRLNLAGSVPTGKRRGTTPYGTWLTCIGNPEMKPTSAVFPSVVPPSDTQPCPP